MTDKPDSPSCSSSGGEHPLNGIRFALPVPEGRHHAEVVASFARWLGNEHDLEPYDLELSESSGKLSFRPLTPARRLELCRMRSHDAVRRACLVGRSSTTLVRQAAAIRNRSLALAGSGRRQRETTQALRASAAELRSRWRERFETSITGALTKRR